MFTHKIRRLLIGRLITGEEPALPEPLNCRIQENPEAAERGRQYILEEEELVEEMVDSVSEAASRPGWRAALEEDAETLVPEDFPEKRAEEEGWRLGDVKYGKEERAVDVPDGASAVSGATCAKAKAAGKTGCPDVHVDSARRMNLIKDWPNLGLSAFVWPIFAC